jgi:hypothetical protein
LLALIPTNRHLKAKRGRELQYVLHVQAFLKTIKKAVENMTQCLVRAFFILNATLTLRSAARLQRDDYDRKAQ